MKKILSYLKMIALSAVCVIVFNTCKKDQKLDTVIEKNPTKDYMEYTNKGLIGAGGGKIQVTDPKSPLLNAFVDVPAGALKSESTISINPVTGKEKISGNSETIIVAMEPSGSQFSSPVRIGIPYSSTTKDVDSLKVYYFNDADSLWIDVPVVSIDKSKKEVIAETTHFTLFSATVYPSIWAQLFYTNNKISANLRMLTPLAQIPLNFYVSMNFQQKYLSGLLNDMEYKYFSLAIHADLYEDTGFLSEHPMLQAKTIYWRFTDWGYTQAKLYSYDEIGKTLFDEWVPLNQIESLISGQMFLFIFDKIQPVVGKKYYLQSSYYYSHVGDNRFFYTPGGIYKSTASGTISDMRKPFDADNDGIVDLFDTKYGNSPNPPSNPTPATNATGISLSPTLSWDCTDPDGDPLTYDVYFGNSLNPTTKVSPNQTSKSYTPSTLTAGVDYYWKVVATDNHSNSTTGPLWKFTTIPPVNQPPTQPTSPSPANNSTGISTSPTLSWTCTDPENDPLTYDIYLGTSSNPTTKVSPDQTAKSYLATNLTAGADYYWKIVAKDNKNNSTPSPVWKFTTSATINQPPTQPSTPSPSNNAIGITTSPTLSWTCSDPENDPLTYDIYFGTSSNPTTKVSPDQTGKSYSPIGLTAGADYYWKIVAKDNKNNTTASPVWKFSTVTTTPNATIKDADGNIYSTVTIGTQIWMTTNLKTTKFADGTSIPLDVTDSFWYQMSSPAYCWYNNDISFKDTYGALYNWYTVRTKKLCPTGWHVPSDEEWTALTTYLGGQDLAGGKLKEIGTIHWTIPNKDATNSSGFTALPGGQRYWYGDFYEIGKEGNWWSSSDSNTHYAWSWVLQYNSSGFGSRESDGEGVSVRCLRDY